MADTEHVVIDISRYTGKNGQILYFKTPKQASEVAAAMRDAGYTGMLRDPAEPEVLLCGRDTLLHSKVYQFWPPNATGRGGGGSSRQGAGRQSQAANMANGSADVNGLEIIDSILTSSGAMEDPSAPVTSVFVKGLPEDATKEKLYDAFSQFGELKNEVNGVNLKTSRDRDPIAFVTFIQAESVPAAVTGPVYVDGQQVTVAERRPRVGRPSRYGGRGGRRNPGPRRNRRNQGGDGDGTMQASGEAFNGPAEL